MNDCDRFPITGVANTEVYVTYGLIKEHEDQLIKNHQLNIEQIMKKGGLHFIEAYCVIHDMDYDDRLKKMSKIILSNLNAESTIYLINHGYTLNMIRQLFNLKSLNDINKELNITEKFSFKF